MRATHTQIDKVYKKVDRLRIELETIVASYDADNGGYEEYELHKLQEILKAINDIDSRLLDIGFQKMREATDMIKLKSL